jgi:hypothetical protein
MTKENFIKSANKVLETVYNFTGKRNVGGEIPEIIKASSHIDYLHFIFDDFFYNIDIIDLAKLTNIEYYQGHLYEFGDMLNFEEINGKYWQDLTAEAKQIITVLLFRNFTNFII